VPPHPVGGGGVSTRVACGSVIETWDQNIWTPGLKRQFLDMSQAWVDVFVVRPLPIQWGGGSPPCDQGGGGRRDLGPKTLNLDDQLQPFLTCHNP
jgi:hypothetical protein